MSDSANNFSSLVHRIAISAQAAIQSNWVAVLLPSEDGDWLVTSADTRPDAPFIRLRHNSQLLKWLETQDAVLRANDPYLSEPAVQSDEWDRALFTEHDVQLAAPVNDGTGISGVLVAGKGVAGSTFPVSALNYFKSISEIAGLALGGSAVNGKTSQQRSDSDDRLLRRMAHDLKGPLSTVMTYIDLVRQNKNGNLSEAQVTRMEKAHRSGRRLHRLLEDFVDYARLRTGSIGLDRTEFSVAELTDEVSTSLEASLGSRNQELRCTTPDRKVKVWADRSRLAQVIKTLVSNASRYSADSTPVDLELQSDGNRLQVRVVDQGRGMSEGQLARIFDPLDPDQPSRRSESDQVEAGSGLGLVIARGFVQLHGGKLHLQSSTGQGTVAEFEMPIVLTGEDSGSDAA